MFKQLPDLSEDEIEKLNALIDRRGPDECWPWKGSRFPIAVGKLKRKARGGYPRHFIRGQSYRATRLALFVATGKQDREKGACHTCDNVICCNDSHLYWGTDQENMDDMKARNRQATGDAAGPRKYPESRQRGADNPFAKITDDEMLEILRAAGDLLDRPRLPRFSIPKLRASCAPAAKIGPSYLSRLIRGDASRRNLIGPHSEEFMLRPGAQDELKEEALEARS